MLLLLRRSIKLLSDRADPVHFVRGRVPSSLAGFLFFMVLVAFVGGIGDRFFPFGNGFLGSGFGIEWKELMFGNSYASKSFSSF